MFEAFELRGRLLYRDLSAADLTSAQKRYLVEEILSNEQVSIAEVSRRYNLKRTTVQDWKKTLQVTGFLQDGKGRPGTVDAEAIRELHTELGKRKLEQRPADEGQVIDLVTDYAHQTSDRQGRIIDDPSSKTVKMIVRSIGATKKKPQIVSNARFKAGSDPRMAYSMWIMALACTKNIPKQMIWNWDATTFIVTVNGKGKLVVTVKLEDDLRPVSLVCDETLDIFIKWMHMGSASGQAIPFVVVVAIAAMKPDEFKVFEIPGLSYSAVPGTVGYLCFTQTRAGNAKFFNWFIKTVAIPTVVNTRSFHESTSRAFASCDSEAMFLDEIFSVETRELLRQSNIDLGKIPASCSGILQPSDVSPLFKAAKTKLRSMLVKHLIAENPIVESHIMTAIDQLQQELKITVGSEHKKKIAHGAISVAHAVQEVLRPRLIEDGFQYPLNFENLMRQSYATLTPDLLETMRAAQDGDVDFFLQHGQLTEEQMTRSGIPVFDAERGVPRDQSVLHHQRAVLLTHDATRDRRAEYINCGLELEPVAVDQTMSKDEADQRKKDIKMLGTLQKRDQKKAQEAERIAGLTAEELAAEKEAKKQRLTANREKRAQDLTDAKLRLNIA